MEIPRCPGSVNLQSVPLMTTIRVEDGGICIDTALAFNHACMKGS